MSGFLRRLKNKVSGADAHVWKQWNAVARTMGEKLDPSDPAYVLITLALPWIEAVVYSRHGHKPLLRVPAETISAEMILNCLQVQTVLYYQYACLFSDAAILPITIYSRVVGGMPVDLLNRFADARTPRLYHLALSEYSAACGFYCSDDSNPPWDALAGFNFLAICAEALPRDIAALAAFYSQHGDGAHDS